MSILDRTVGALMIGLALAGAPTAWGGEPAYFACQYAPPSARPDAQRTARVMVDRDKWQVVWVERGASEWLERTFYEIVAVTPQEVVARTERGGEALFLRLDLVAGEWSVTMPLDRSQNRNVWDPAEQRMGYPESVQLYTEVGGTCVVMAPD